MPSSSVPQLPISVIVPVHNGGENFHRCLSSLAEAVPPPKEIIVVADGDTDGSWHMASEFETRLLRLPVPKGPARARNLGALIVQGKILFFVDADVVIPKDAIAQIAAIFNDDPGLAALFGSYDDEPFSPNFLSQYKNLFHHYIHQTAYEEASTFWSGCGAIRRDVFMELGGFNESYRKPCIEDIELGYRLRQAGYRIHLCKTLQVKHLKRWSIISLLTSDFFQRALPWTKLIIRDHAFINDLNLRSSSRVSIILIYGLLATVIGAGWWPGMLVVGSALILLLLMINNPLYQFFKKKRGLRFAVQAIPWHWFYYFYSGLAFVIGFCQYFFFRHRSPKLNISAIPKEVPDVVSYPECHR